MAETANYHLYIEDDSQTKFVDWRTRMNGGKDSNMTKIDAALSAKAEKSRVVYGTLSAGSWVGSPPRQSLPVPGMAADQNGTISLSHEADAGQRESAKLAQMSIVGQSDSALMIVADGVKPELDIPVCIVFLG